MKAIQIIICMVLVCFSAAVSARPPDALDETLALVGLQREDLGWEAKGWWPRYPDVPYKLRAFDDLFSAPLDNIAFARSLAATAEQNLDPLVLNELTEAGDGQLFQVVQRLGIDPKFGGFRGYSANLTAERETLDKAILTLTRQAGRPTRFVTFGTDSRYPVPQEDLQRLSDLLPEGVSQILGQLVLNISDAYRWAELAFRKVDGQDRAVVAQRTNLGEELIDALDYCPQVDDVARTLDEASLWYAAQKCVQALDLARISLLEISEEPFPDFVCDWESPWGWLRFRGGGADKVDGDNALLIVDLGGNDVYTGGVAASTATRPIGLLLDLAGDDEYLSEVPAQGAGLTGVGILLERE